jgi:hypothetical protein
MDRHRTRFLASLSARLERERALRESEEAESPALWHRPAERPDPAEEPASGEVPEADRSADILEPGELTTPAEVIAIRRSPGRRGSQVEAVRRRDPDEAPSSATPWSETGMSQALRDAIASVRRVSHHGMPERPLARADQVRYAPRRFDDEPAVEQGSFYVADTDPRPAFDDQELSDELRFDHPAAAERFDDQAVYEESPLAAPDTGPQQPLEQTGVVDEWPARAADWAEERASLAEDPPQEELRFDDEADAPLPFSGRRPRGRSSFDGPAARTVPLGEDAAIEERLFDDGWQEDAPPGLQEVSRERAPVWRGVTQRRGLHLAALVLAPIFVLLAGFGFGILSGAQEFDRVLTTLGWTSIADGSVGAAPTDPAPPATTSARSSMSDAAPPPEPAQSSMSGAAPSPEPAQSSMSGAAPSPEPAPSPQVSELETVRVAPLPAPPRVEEPPTDPATSDMPLPPPPKPAPWSSLSGEASGASAPIESAVDAAAGALPAADGAVNGAVEDAAVAALETEEAGGSFAPILIKSSASEPRVFVHYTEGAPGRPTALIRQLRAAGFKVEERPVEVSIAENSIRYFFPGDRDEAEALGAQLQSQVPGDAAVPIVDLTSYEPKPRRGHLEVWLGR